MIFSEDMLQSEDAFQSANPINYVIDNVSALELHIDGLGYDYQVFMTTNKLETQKFHKSLKNADILPTVQHIPQKIHFVFLSREDNYVTQVGVNNA